MNNGRPPYGDPSQWGQQPAAGQENPAQYAPGQNPYGQYAQQGSYQQPSAGAYQQPYQQNYGQPADQSQPWQPQTYQPQARQAQESYQQQSWQPYGQQQSWQQGSYQQPSYQQPQQPGGYQQSNYQQGGFQQGGYQQSAQQSWQQPMYQQGMQNGQPLQQGYPQQNPAQPAGQFFPAQGYSGYVTQPAAEEKGMPISEEVIAKVALFGVLPVLFLLAVIFKQPVLCWVFLAGAAATVAAMWLREMVDSNLRLVSTMICGVLAVVALIVALNGPGKPQELLHLVPHTFRKALRGMKLGFLLRQERSQPGPLFQIALCAFRFPNQGIQQGRPVCQEANILPVGQQGGQISCPQQ